MSHLITPLNHLNPDLSHKAFRALFENQLQADACSSLHWFAAQPNWRSFYQQIRCIIILSKNSFSFLRQRRGFLIVGTPLPGWTAPGRSSPAPANRKVQTLHYAKQQQRGTGAEAPTHGRRPGHRPLGTEGNAPAWRRAGSETRRRKQNTSIWARPFGFIFYYFIHFPKGFHPYIFI